MIRQRTLGSIGLTLAVALVLFAGAAGCTLPGVFPGTGTEPEIQFWASEEVVPRGGCTLVHWEVSGAEDYPIFLDGKEVPPSGAEEVCLEEPTTFELVVGMPGGSIRETMRIEVEGEGPEPPPEEAPPEEAPPEEPPPAGGPEAIILIVDPDTIPQGGCAMLHWEVLPPEWPVFINGQDVPPVGEREECPGGTTTYELVVEAPQGPQTRGATLHVEGAPPPEPTPQPPPAPAATATQPPPAQPTATTPPPPGPSPTPKPFTTDLAMTDLYADKLLNGTVYGRITNRGPGSLVNVVVNFSCQWAKTAYGATFGLNEQMGPRNMTITGPLPPGQDTPFNTYITVDLTKYWYNMTCTVNVPFTDPNTGNNTYNEKLARP